MGNKPTLIECLDHLGITTSSQKAFKQDVLDYLQERGKCEFTILEDDEVPKLVRDYVQSTNFTRWKPYTQQMNQLSESRYIKWLEQLVQIWIEDKRKQESQDDPSYTSNKSKKRKRNTEQADNQRAISSYYSPSHRVESNSFASTSSSVNSGQDSPQDIDHHLSEEESLPDASALIADRPSKEKASRSQRRQTPVAASTSPDMSSVDMARSLSRTVDASAIDFQTAPAQNISFVRTPESARQRIPHQLGSPQSFRDESEQTKSASRRRRSMVESEGNGRESATVRAASDVFEPLFTPPPTVKRPAFIKTKNLGFASDHLDRLDNPREDSDAWKLLDEIVEYIDTCEKHSIRIAQNPNSPPEQVQKQRIRAQVFTNLKRDIESRIETTLDDDGIKGKTPITTYCLWSGTTLDPS